VGIGFSREFLKPYTVLTLSQTPARIVIRLEGITDREGAQALVDQAVYLDKAEVLVDESNWHNVGDIIDCVVRIAPANNEPVTRDAELGTITDVLLLPGNDVWVVTTPEGREVLLPVIDDVIKSVDIANKVVTVHLIPGLLEPEDES
jgi:16S rRNA processing protein RimM